MTGETNTSEMVGTVDDCLYSIGNRIEVAKILSEMGKTRLLETILEDIARSVQDMWDEHCVVK